MQFFIDDRNVVTISVLTVVGAADDGVQLDNGNVIAITNNPTLCETTGGAFTATIRFTNGTVLQDNVAPCN